ncbi:LuxR family transcriptional regulator [Brevundimonas sp.]|uniref:helix-turn-helix transcriptional regulator n=1 Tax=Brevundimonas sp. TaxID=1871086 RepID=UPI002D2F3595|nr:LuxR family transcriptional regulator [Brevundimonas sp.]HYD27235.1 LuxR family transcriptional regulator [Brevundimonas sp.]
MISGTAGSLLQQTLLTVESLNSADSQRCLIARVTGFLQQFGFSAFGMTRLPRLSGAEPDVLLDAWPEGWSEHYHEAGLFRHDPLVQHSLTARDVFAWDEVPGGYMDDPRAAAIPRDAAEFDMREGLCVPLPSALGVGSLWLGGARLERVPGLKHAVRLLAYHVSQALEALPATPTGVRALTIRESDVLAWVAGGKTTRDVATILGISEHTVGEHLKNIRRKLGTSNNTHSTVRALQLGLLRL